MKSVEIRSATIESTSETTLIKRSTTGALAALRFMCLQRTRALGPAGASDEKQVQEQDPAEVATVVGSGA